MKSNYDLKKMKKREGSVKVDPEAGELPFRLKSMPVTWVILGLKPKDAESPIRLSLIASSTCSSQANLLTVERLNKLNQKQYKTSGLTMLNSE